MINKTKGKSIRVLDAGTSAPLIIVPVDQVPEVQALLDAHQFGYTVDEEAISIDGRPLVHFIYFQRGTDHERVQQVLDSVEGLYKAEGISLAASKTLGEKKTMVDTATGKPIRVMAYGDNPPDILVPFDRLPEIQALLDAHQFSYMVDEETISTDGKPEVIFIYFQRGTDPERVQRVLDSVG